MTTPYQPNLSHSFSTRQDTGLPSGGSTTGIGLTIRWHDGGGTAAAQKNGAFLEDLIEAASERLRYFQDNTLTSCRENQDALYHLAKAEEALQTRATRLAAARNNPTPTGDGPYQ